MPKCSRRPIDNVALARRGIDAVQDQGVPEEHTERRNGVDQQAAKNISIGKNPGRFLAHAQQLCPQIVLDLGPIETPVNRQRRHQVGAEENAMVLFNVLEFDGEAVGGRPDLILGQQQRRRIPFFAPPAEDGFGSAPTARV